MKLRKVLEHEKVRCIGAEYCGREECVHYANHPARKSMYLFRDCRLPSYCRAIGGFVMDQPNWDEEECPCDPNLEFRRRRRLGYET